MAAPETKKKNTSTTPNAGIIWMQMSWICPIEMHNELLQHKIYLIVSFIHLFEAILTKSTWRSYSECVLPKSMTSVCTNHIIARETICAQCFNMLKSNNQIQNQKLHTEKSV